MAALNGDEPSVHEVLDEQPTAETPASPFNTLWTEFARGRQRISPPRSPTLSIRMHPLSAELHSTIKQSRIDLRALDYVTDYDSNLMCPICHVPFIEPVVLDCDHTFCEECFEHYTAGGSSTDRSTCPACRTYHLGHVRKASRLIKNMCNDIQVRCPNKDCKTSLARGCMEQHILSDCLEEQLSCPIGKCTRVTKRKNFVPGQCVHNTHVECECGATIQLGRGEWLRHKDQECPNIQLQDKSQEGSQSPSTTEPQCPGFQFGCSESLTADNMDSHAVSCIFARLAPHLRKQSLLLKSAQEQLTIAKLRNDALETSFTRLEEIIISTVQPKLDRLVTLSARPVTDTNENDSVSDIEEIPRTDLYSSQSLEAFPAITLDDTSYHMTNDPDRQAVNVPFNTSHSQSNPQFDPVTQHLLSSASTHASHLSSLDQSLQNLTAQLHDLDARSSMALMNETLRIREDLNIFNGAMHSTRTQVQWLLNRERILGQREAMASGWASGARGRPPALSQQNANGDSSGSGGSGGFISTENTAGGVGTATPTQASMNAGSAPTMPSSSSSSSAPSASVSAGYRPSFDRNMSSAWSSSQAVSAGGASSGHSSTATSPIFGAARPSLRRASGGSSQERVKL